MRLAICFFLFLHVRDFEPFLFLEPMTLRILLSACSAPGDMDCIAGRQADTYLPLPSVTRLSFKSLEPERQCGG